jgi:hypothetical protein
MTHNELKVKALTKPSVKAEYDDLLPQFNLIREMLLARENAEFRHSDVTATVGNKIMNVTQ